MLSILTHVQSAARAARPLSVRPNVGVRLVEGVTAEAFSLPCMLGSLPFTTEDILTLRHGLHVSGVHARANPAQMVNVEINRDRPAVHLVTEPMNCDSGSFLPPHQVHLPVASAPKSPGPEPALAKVGPIGRDRPISVDVSPESLSRGMVGSHRKSSFRCHAAGGSRLAAALVYPKIRRV